MQKSQFVYATYIRTTPEKLWEALIEPKFTRQYWFDTHQESEWKPGAPWKALAPDGTVICSGEVVELEPYTKMVLKWRTEKSPEQKAEGYSRMTYQIEKQDVSVKLTVLHEMDVPESKTIKGVSGGWPIVLASLKSLLETGKALEDTLTWKECQ